MPALQAELHSFELSERVHCFVVFQPQENISAGTGYNT